MAPQLIICSAVGLLMALLYFEKTNYHSGLIPTKFVLSTLFIVSALVAFPPTGGYRVCVLAGLLCCLGGDVLLALPHQSMFLFGLVSFLAGHIFYVFAFALVSDVNRLTTVGLAITTAVGIAVWRWLRPHLGSMKIPVILYILVISMMVCGAWSVLGMSELNASGRGLVLSGAMCFYLSDLCVARQRFVKTAFLNRLVGLPLYYSGQFMIAFSVGSLS